MPFGVVYLITNLVNGKYYVGQTTTSIKRRWASHVSQAKTGKGYLIHRAIRKYGPDAFECQIAADAEDKQSLLALEKLWIWAMRSQDPTIGYNQTCGGESFHSNPDTFARMSAAHKGAVITLEHRRKISESSMGRRLSDEHKAKLRGRPVSQETRAKLSMARRGKPLSAEHREKLAAAKRGVKQTASHRENRARSLRGKTRAAVTVIAASAHHYTAEKLARRDEIVSLRDSGMEWALIGSIFGVSRSTVAEIYYSHLKHLRAA